MIFHIVSPTGYMAAVQVVTAKPILRSCDRWSKSCRFLIWAVLVMRGIWKWGWNISKV